MHRVQAILVVIALLATPLALLARGIACNPSECDCMALCARQAAMQHQQQLCGAAKRAPMCGTHRGNHALDYGLIAPMAPTAPLPHAQVAPPAISSECVASYALSAVAGFSSVPFEPPRG